MLEKRESGKTGNICNTSMIKFIFALSWALMEKAGVMAVSPHFTENERAIRFPRNV